MIQAVVTSTEMQNNFGRYLNMVSQGGQVIVTRNGKEVGRFIPVDYTVEFLTDSLTGVLHKQYLIENMRSDRLSEKYEDPY